MRIVALPLVDDEQDLEQFGSELLNHLVLLLELSGDLLHYYRRLLHLGLALFHLLFAFNLCYLHLLTLNAR